MGMMEMGRELVELKGKKDDLNARLRDVNEQIDRLAEPLVSAMLQETCTKFEVEGRVVHLYRQKRAKIIDGDTAGLATVCIEFGFPDLVTVNHQKLGALARNEEVMAGLHPEIASRLEVTEVVEPRVRKSFS